MNQQKHCRGQGGSLMLPHKTGQHEVLATRQSSFARSDQIRLYAVHLGINVKSASRAMQHEVTCRKPGWQSLPNQRRASENHLTNLAAQCKLLKVYYDLQHNHSMFLTEA